MLDVDERTVKTTNLEVAKAKIGCDNEQLIPKEFHAVIDSLLCRIRIYVLCKMIILRHLLTTTSLTGQVPVILADGRGGDLKGKGLAGQDQQP